MNATEQSTVEIIRQALADELDGDPDVFLLGEDIGVYGGAFGVTRGLLERFGPQRVVDTPISEGGFIGLAVGAALAGLRPVAEIMFMDFITLAMDQLINQAAKLHYVFGEQAHCPLVVRAVSGGGRCYGPTHSQSLEALFTHIPGIKVVVPGTPRDAGALLKTAVRDDNPVLFVEHKRLYRQTVPLATQPAHIASIPFGQAQCLRSGEDLTLVSWSGMTADAIQAADMLAEDGVHSEHLDLRTLCPLDMDAILKSVAKTGMLAIVEEGCRTGGFAAEIACRVQEQAYDLLEGPVLRIASPDVPVPSSPALERAMLPDAGCIYNRIMDVLEG